MDSNKIEKACSIALDFRQQVACDVWEKGLDNLSDVQKAGFLIYDWQFSAGPIRSWIAENYAIPKEEFIKAIADSYRAIGEPEHATVFDEFLKHYIADPQIIVYSEDKPIDEVLERKLNELDCLHDNYMKEHKDLNFFSFLIQHEAELLGYSDQD